MGRRGFTLVELLVVIAIVAVLAAILFPVFAQAREKGRQATCLHHLRQIAVTTSIYISDNEDTLPSADGVWEALLRYSYSPLSLSCPTRGRSVRNGYVYNVNLSGMPASKVEFIGPAGIVACDGRTPGVSYGTGASANWLSERPLPNVCYNPGYLDYRHAGKFLAAYLDGHAALTDVGPPSDVPWTVTAPSTATYPKYDPAAPHTGSTVNNGRTAGEGTLAVSTWRMLDGQLSFRCSAVNATLTIGFAPGEPASDTTFDYALHNLDGEMMIVVNGGIAYSAGPVSTEKRYAIERSHGRLSFKKDGVEIFSPAGWRDPRGPDAPPLPVYLRAAAGADHTVCDVMMAGAR